MHRRWLALARDVVGWSMRRAEQRGAPLRLTLGLDDLIFSTSRLILAAQLWFHRWQPVDYLRSFPDGYTVASYRRQLLSPQPANVLITGDRRGAPITREKGGGRALARIHPVNSFTMPDGRKIRIWWRERPRNS
jgi:hypothetical protein